MRCACGEVERVYGYRCCDVRYNFPQEYNTDIKFTENFLEYYDRRFMATRIGPKTNFCPSIGDTKHPPSVELGVAMRMGRKMPTRNIVIMKKFEKFVKCYIRKHFKPISVHDLPSEKESIMNMNQPLWRKEELLRALEKNELYGLPQKFTVKCFGKTEFLTEEPDVPFTYLPVDESAPFKGIRGIYSREDRAKVYLARYFEAISEQVFHSPDFIKYITMRERPEYIRNKFGSQIGKTIYETDFTNFEGINEPGFYKFVEKHVYDYFLQNFPGVSDNIHRILAGDNRCKFRHFKCVIPGRRMSGEMNTSLGNGLVNIMMLKFVAKLSHANIEAVVEGDDGLFISDKPLKESLFGLLGCKIKMNAHTDIREASFCGMRMSSNDDIFAPAGRVLVSLPWSTSPIARGGIKKRLGLLKSKCLSILYQYPNCPIVTSIAVNLLARIHVDAIWPRDFWHEKTRMETLALQKQTEEMVLRGIPSSSRVEYEQMYGIPIGVQYDCEEELRRNPFDFTQPALQAVMSGYSRSALFYSRFSTYSCEKHADNHCLGVLH